MRLTKLNYLLILAFLVFYGGWAIIAYQAGISAGDYTSYLFSGTDIFYEFQSSFDSVVLVILPMLFFPLFFSVNSVFAEKTGYSRFLIERFESRRHYLVVAFRKNFMVAFFVGIVWQLLFLVLISITMGGLKLFGNPDLSDSLTETFVKNGLVNLVIFILLASVGWAIFSSLVMAIGLFIKNPYLYVGVGPIAGLLLTLVGALIGANRLGYASFLPVLTNPGGQMIGGAYPTPLILTYCITAVVYLVATIALVELYLRTKFYENRHQ